LLNGLSDLKIKNMVSKLSFKEVADIINESKLFIGMDSSLYNLAYILHKKIICIYGLGNTVNGVGAVEHRGDDINIVKLNMDCSGCEWNCKYKSSQDETAPCVENINEDRIKDAIKKVLF